VRSPASCSILAPASSANLGPGFDCLAVALDRWLRVDLWRVEGNGIHDAGSPDLLGGSNLVVDAMRVAASRLGLELPGCEILVTGDIPVARGLGSSAAAIVAGIRAAGVLAETNIPDAVVTDIGGAMEGHADNISASVYGGVTISALTDCGYVAEVLVHELPWTAVVYIPDGAAFTHVARGILPQQVSIPDAVSNISRGILLAHALRERRADLLREAMRDRLHQPYRAAIFPHLDPVIAAALAAEAHGACLSGAGPSVLAFADDAVAVEVAQAMRAAGRLAGVDGEVERIAVAARGCYLRE
jgi:homoserine kinase